MLYLNDVYDKGNVPLMLNLTLTSVVFESFNHEKSLFLPVLFNFNKCCTKNKSCNKENFSMLQLFLLILLFGKEKVY